MALRIISHKSIFYNLNKEKVDSLVSKLDYKGVSSIKSSFLRIKVFKDFSKDHYKIVQVCVCIRNVKCGWRYLYKDIISG